MRRSGGLVVVATLGWLIVLAGLAAFVGAPWFAPTASGPIATPTIGVGSGGPTATAAGSPPPSGLPLGSELPAGTAILVGAGDIATCGLDGDEATADLLDRLPGAVFTAGDNAYEDGTPAQFANCYDPSWGRHLDRTRPAAGNHDWLTRGAAGYLDYFGSSSTNAEGQTWYSYDLGDWHVIVLDSNCEMVDGCGPDSPQGVWLAADLGASRARCAVAIWHHPRFSSGEHGSDPVTDPFWRALTAAGADVVVNGHDHDYERFAPQDADGVPDGAGIREFIVGTGGAALRDFPTLAPNSVVRSSLAHGVLELTLQPGGYVWRFISTDGSFSDQGSATCH
jgi:hypothetical protein